jgi:hypothetical protein
MFVRENVSSMVPAAPPEPDTAIRSWDGWQVEVEAGPVVVVGALVVDVEEAWDVDVDLVELAGFVEHPASSSAIPTVAAIPMALRGRGRTAGMVMRDRGTRGPLRNREAVHRTPNAGWSPQRWRGRSP